MDNKPQKKQNSFEDIKKLVDLCIQHASNLITSAKLIAKENQGNIAYHLAALALEEVGKSIMISVGYTQPVKNDEKLVSERFSEDHAKKLFWALWMVRSYERKHFSKEEIDNCRDLAYEIHSNRLDSLYINPNNSSQPIKKIPIHKVNQLIDLVEIRIKLAETQKIEAINDEDIDIIHWFYDAMDDKEVRNLIWGQKSLDEYEKLKDIKQWMRWLFKLFKEADVESENLRKQELERIHTSEKDEKILKWKYKVRLFTNTHTIRTSTLAWWNNNCEFIKLYSSKKDNSIIAEFILPKTILGQTFWWYGLLWSRKFITALNIASQGFFWWYIPQHVKRYYEELWDLEHNCKVDIVFDGFEMKWGNRVLRQEDMERTLIVLSKLPDWNDLNAWKPYELYLRAISLLGRNDIHTQFEYQIFLTFYNSIKAGLLFYKDWDGESSVYEVLNTLFSQHEPILDEISTCFKIAEKIEQHEIPRPKVTLEEVGKMKVFCDIYFFKKIYTI